jgi:hypothetical protein
MTLYPAISIPFSPLPLLVENEMDTLGGDRGENRTIHIALLVEN